MSGPACSVCRHQNCAEIDEALAGGASLVPTARRFGVSKSALGRHKINCLAPRLAAAARITSQASHTRRDVERARAIASGEMTAEAADVLSLSALVARLATSLTRLDSAADQAAGASAHSALAALSGQLHRGIEAAAKIQRFYDEPPTASAFSIVINVGDPTTGPQVEATSSQGALEAEPVVMIPSFAKRD
ncbi:MAG TPA: hypothetical protein VD906_02715 [Caulobacteraceae bacterium]|nr:hypothetical protein [Caulobacteraceae bacterium]